MEQIIFQTRLNYFESSALWGWHFLVPQRIAELFVNGADRRVVCTINQTVKIHCALMPNKGEWFVLLNKDVQKKINRPLNTIIEILIEKDTSTYGMPMPEVFQEVLDQDPEAEAYFEALTPGKKRSLIYIVGKVKNVDSRIRKSIIIAEHLKTYRGKIESKMLMEALKL